MSLDPSTHVPLLSRAVIEKRLKAVRALIRRSQRTRACFLLLTAVAGGILLLMLVDFIFAPVPVVVRWILTLLWLTGAVIVACMAFAPLRREIRLVQIARWIEGRHPEMQERLSTVLQLAGNSGRTVVSEELLSEIANAAGDDIVAVNAEAEVRSARTRRQWRFPAIGAIALLLLSLVLWPRESSRLLLRAVVPFTDVGNAGASRFVVQPGNVQLFEGGRLEVSFTSNPPLESAEVWLAEEKGTQTIQKAVKTGNGFSFILDPVGKPLRYQVRSGRDQGDVYTVTVFPKPSVEQAVGSLKYPDYTGLAPEEVDVREGVAAVAGTKISLEVDIDTPVDAGWVEAHGKLLGEAEISSRGEGSRVSFAWELPVERSADAAVLVARGRAPRIECIRFPVEIVEDIAPVVTISYPSADALRVKPEQIIPIRYKVEEDFGVSVASIEVKAKGKTQVYPQKIPFRDSSGDSRLFVGTAPLSAAGLLRDFPDTREFEVRMVVSDNRPVEFGGARSGRSASFRLTVDENADSIARAELRNLQDRANRSLARLIQSTRRAGVEVETVKAEILKPKPAKDALAKLGETTGRLGRDSSAAQRLADELASSLHASKEPLVASASRNLDEARKALDEAPLQDDPDRRSERIAAAGKAINLAIADLLNAKEKLSEDTKAADDVLARKELADRQATLAELAKEHANDPDGKWREEQEKVAKQLEDQQAASKPVSRQLQEDAEEARKLAMEASRLSRGQRDLAGKGREQEARPDEVRQQQLREDREAQAAAAAKFAEDVERLTTHSPEEAAAQAVRKAQDAAKEAHAASKESSPQQAADANMKSAGKLEQTAADLAKVAEDLEEAAKQTAAGEQEQNPQPVSPKDPEARNEMREMAANAMKGMSPQQAAEKAAEQAVQARRDAQEASEGSKEAQQKAAAQARQAAEDAAQQAKQSEERARQAAQRAAAKAEQAKEEARQAAQRAQEGDETGRQQAQQTAARAEEEQGKAEQSQQAARDASDAAKLAQEAAQQAKDAAEKTRQAGNSEQVSEKSEQAQQAAQQAQQAAQMAQQAAQQAQQPDQQSQEPQPGQPGEPSEQALQGQLAEQARQAAQKAQQQAAAAAAQAEKAEAFAQAAKQMAEQAAQQAERAADSARSPGQQRKAQQMAANAEAASKRADDAQEQASLAMQEAQAAKSSADQVEAQSMETQDSAEQLAQGRGEAPTQESMEELMEDAAAAANQAAAAQTPEEAARQAAAAAQALAAAAEEALRQLGAEGMPQQGQQEQGGQQASQEGSPGMGEPNARERKPGGDPGAAEGVANLGASSGDWERIRNANPTDHGAREVDGVPPEYRGLVMEYFRTITNAGSGNRKANR